jgi:tellurite resistance protein TerB
MGFFSKLGNSASRQVNRNVLEAGAAAALLVAASEGGISKDEMAGVKTALSSNPKLSGFAKKDIDAIVAKYSTILEDNFRVGQTQLLREIADVADNEVDAEDTIVLAISIAERDGEIGDKEMATLRKIADRLNLNLEDVIN